MWWLSDTRGIIYLRSSPYARSKCYRDQCPTTSARRVTDHSLGWIVEPWRYGTRLKKNSSQKCVTAVYDTSCREWNWGKMGMMAKGERVGRLERRTSHGRWSTLRWPRNLILKGHWIFSASNFNILSTALPILLPRLQLQGITRDWRQTFYAPFEDFIVRLESRTRGRNEELTFEATYYFTFLETHIFTMKYDIVIKGCKYLVNYI